MIARITPHALCGQICAIGSKSFAHRALICAGLFAKQTTKIVGITPSNDIRATVNCLRALGVEIQEGEVYIVKPLDKLPNHATLDCIESGSTLRFFMPIVCALGVDCKFVGSERLLERTNKPLFDELQNHGIVIDNFHFQGKLKAGEYNICASVSSQYITGLLFALSLLDGESRLHLQGEIVSKQYIQISLDVMRAFGVKIDEIDDGFVVHGMSKVDNAPDTYTVEGDWSNVAFALIGGATGGDVKVAGLNLNSCQGDMAVVDILKSAGADISFVDGLVRIKKSSLKAFSVCAQQMPDMVPALSVLAAFCNGTTHISGVERLRDKESDRLQAVLDMLHTAGIDAKYVDGELLIEGSKDVKAGNFVSFNDHRMAMSETVLALNSNGVSVIDGAGCVSKSYPEFYQDIRKLGGEDCVLLQG